VALGIALAHPDRQVVVLDGDAAVIMHMGSLAINGQYAPSNLLHVVLNNAQHESVGGQPNAAGSIDVPGLLRACGVDGAVEAKTEAEIADGMRALSSGRAVAMVLHTRQGSRDDLGRPTISPADNKGAMMRRIGSAG
jgi:phosphonopyruvate decarboxylase